MKIAIVTDIHFSGLMNYLKLMSAAEAKQLQTEVAVADNIQE